MCKRSMYAKQDESEERGHSRQVGRAAEDDPESPLASLIPERHPADTAGVEPVDL